MYKFVETNLHQHVEQVPAVKLQRSITVVPSFDPASGERVVREAHALILTVIRAEKCRAYKVAVAQAYDATACSAFGFAVA